MADIVIIGAGRLGTSLGRALAGKGHLIRALTCRRKESAEESRSIIGQGRAMTDNAAAARLGTVIFLCLPDEEIHRVASRLARSRVDWTGKTVFHSSGLLPSRVLEPLKKRGALIASFHPGQAFPSKKTWPSHFRGISFGLEGDKKALAAARGLVRQLGGRALVIPEDAKPLYHAALSFASNFFVILLDAAAGLLSQAKIPRNKAARMLFPLLQGTLHNVKKLDTAASLTGPLVRGDAATVGAHLDALKGLPQYAEVYRKLSLMGLEIARKSGLSPKKVRALKSRLEGR
jgi:predicted short-subunit dehydrogenase-like oxidoreductase (DUF2520 family)